MGRLDTEAIWGDSGDLTHTCRSGRRRVSGSGAGGHHPYPCHPLVKSPAEGSNRLKSPRIAPNRLAAAGAAVDSLARGSGTPLGGFHPEANRRPGLEIVTPLTGERPCGWTP